MGRIAGVTATETRSRLLDAAAKVFARQGYDGASIVDITAEAGLSSGAVYAHFGSKAELFAATLRSHGGDEVERLLDTNGGVDVAHVLARRGTLLARRRPQDGSLLVEAIVTAKRHPEVARSLAAAVAVREARLSDVFASAQGRGALDDGVAPDCVARFVLMLALGSLLVGTLELPEPDRDDWAGLVHSLVDRFRP